MRSSAITRTRLVSFIVLVVLIVTLLISISPRGVWSAAGQSDTRPSPDGVWDVVGRDARGLSANSRFTSANSRSVRLNRSELTRLLERVPREVAGTRVQGNSTLTLPLPNEGFARFAIEESSVLEPSLAAQYPEIRSFRGRGLDDSTLSARFDWTPQGFHATVSSGLETFVVHPENVSDAAQYVVYQSADDPLANSDLLCEVNKVEGRERDTTDQRAQTLPLTNSVSAIATGPSLRTFRIAVAATQEYTNSFGGGSVGGTIASINTWLNGLNQLYERELAIRFVLVGNDSNVIYTSEPDPFTNGSTGSMIEESRALLNAQIGVGNYDIGHVLGAQGGTSAQGRAYLSVTCWEPYKGAGATVIGTGFPLGSSSIVGVIGHEFGHEMGADHSFNASCSGNRGPNSAWESGSGLTMMSYANNCPPDNIVSGRSLHFHAGSIGEINGYISGGASCAAISSTGNSAPVVNAGPDYTIPRNTPFMLVAAASDADAGDQGNLTYSWEQVDAGGLSYVSPPYSDSGDPTGTTRPIFRPFVPNSNPARIFPSLTYILNNANVPPAVINNLQTAENLPSVSRQLTFDVAVRDGHGGTTLDRTVLTVAGGAGPFRVTQPNSGESWNSGTQQTVAWNVSGTNAAPVNCSQVKISLSLDGGQTFPVILAASTPNDGSESLLLPSNQASSAARIKVEAVGNIFFDISDANFSLAPPNSCHAINGLSPQVGYPGNDVFMSGVNLTGVSSVTFGGNVAASFSIISSTSLRATVPVGAVSGTIKVSKPSCSDVITQAFTVSSTPSVLLNIDDGGYESAYSASGYAVNRLTPTAYPATLASVSIYFASFTNISVGTPIDVLVGVNSDGDSNIDNTSFQVVPTSVQALNQFNVYSVPNLTITSGDFVVGFRYTPSSGVYPVVFDRTPPARGRSYGSGDGISFALQDTYGANFAGNAGIRANVFQGAQGPTCNPSVTPLSLNVSSAAGNASASVTVSSGCPWTAQNSLSWVTITAPPGNGNGTATFTVNANSGAARSGVITIAGRSVLVRQGASFADVPANNAFFEMIGKVSATGISLGCGQDQQGNLLYCPGGAVTREQMAAFIIRALGDFGPPTPTQQRFLDVPPSNALYAFVEQLAVRNITLGCSASGPLYCPTGNVTREQMAAFLIRGIGDFSPVTPPQQRFSDVPPSNVFYAFIDEMAVRGITLGCDAQGTMYCPGSLVTREQMAAFLVRAFGL